MLKRWMFAGVVAVSLAAVSLSTVDVAAQVPKVAPKKSAKPAKLDLSQLSLLRAGAGVPDAPHAARIGPGKAVDTSLEQNRLNIPPALTEPERAALRERLAALLDIEVASLPAFRRTSHINAPGDSIVLALNSPPGASVVINVHDARKIYRPNNGLGFVEFAGDDIAGRAPAVSITTDAEGERTYLYTCYIPTDLPTLNVTVFEYGPHPVIGNHFTLPITNGKLFVPYETAGGALSLQLVLSFDGVPPGKTVVLSHCELTRVR